MSASTPGGDIFVQLKQLADRRGPDSEPGRAWAEITRLRARVNGLIEANNAEVERRRTAERQLTRARAVQESPVSVIQRLEATAAPRDATTPDNMDI